MTEIKVECCSQTIHITFLLQYILSLDRHAARYGIQLDFNGTTHRSEFVFSLLQVKVLQSGLSKARWLCRRWCVGFIWPFSPSFTSSVFFVACHIWPEQELWLWPSRRSSPWKLTAEISQSWNIFVFRSLKSCFEAPMSPTTCNWPP